MLSKKEQQKTLISDLNKKIEKMRFLDKQTFTEISGQVDGYRKEMFRQKYRMPHRKFKTLTILFGLTAFYGILSVREVGFVSYFRGLHNGIELKKAAFLFQATEDKLNMAIDKRREMMIKVAMDQVNEKTKREMLKPFQTTDKIIQLNGRDVLSTCGVVNDPMPAIKQVQQRSIPKSNNFNI